MKARRSDDLVIFGAGQMGTTIARVLHATATSASGSSTPTTGGATEAAEALPEARVFCAHAFDA